MTSLSARYTAAELLAYTVCHLFPDAKLLAGGVNEFGFYYDFVFDYPIDDNFVTLIEENMRGFAKKALPISRREMMRENAAGFFEHLGQSFKAALVSGAAYNVLELIEIDGFFDLAPSCPLETTEDAGLFKIFDVEKLSYHLEELGLCSALRITGEVFSDKQQLKRFVKQQKADLEAGHRVLVQSMGLFALNEEMSELSHSWLPNGVAIRTALLDGLRREDQKAGVLQVETPGFLKSGFLKKSFDSPLRKSRFDCSWEDQEYRASQSPVEAHACLFKAKLRHLCEMPVRYGEVKEIFVDGVWRSALFGMLSTPSQLTDFMHAFCAPQQLYAEIISSLQFIGKMVTILGLRCQWSLCSRRIKSGVSPKQWDQTLALMRQALEECNCTYTEDLGDSVPSGPLLKGKFQDLSGRWWSGPQIGVDFHVPTQQKLCYVNAEGEKTTPLLLKRTVFGSLERLIALLIEKEGGVLPLWLAPEQVRVIAVGDGRQDYANLVLLQLQQAGVRAAGDLRSNSLGCSLGMKIHDCERARVPYALIVGDSEEREKIVNVRKCGHKATPLKMSLSAFIQQLQQEEAFYPPWEAPGLPQAAEL